MGWAGQVARVAKNRNGYEVSTGISKVKRAIGISRKRWTDNIKVGLKEIGREI
jgi:hypothetical protein